MKLVKEGKKSKRYLLVRVIGPGALVYDDKPESRIFYDYLEINWGNESPSYADSIVSVPKKMFRFTACKRIHEKYDLFSGYDVICIADDDVIPADGKTWADIIRAFEKTEAGLGQPALTRGSYYSHPITLQHGASKYRYVSFVEGMVTLFTKESFLRQVTVFDCAEDDFDWGLDVVLSHREMQKVIIDETPIVHTRPVGQNYNKQEGWKRAEKTFKKFGIDWKVPVIHRTIA